MKPLLLRAAAVLFFSWELAAAALWLRAHPSFGAAAEHAWSAVRSDWMALLFFTDMAVFSLLCLVWMARDARRRGLSRGATAAWVGAAVVIGSPVLLVYLSRRD